MTPPPQETPKVGRPSEPEDQDVMDDALRLKNRPSAKSREKPVLRTGPRPRHHPSCWSVVGHAGLGAGHRLFAP